MEFGESLRMSLRAIRGHRVRSSLSAFGVVIGVAAVITLVTLGTSLRAEILSQFAGDRAPNMFVWVGPPGGGPGFGAQAAFTQHDIAGLRRLDGVAAVVPQGVVPVVALAHGGETVSQNDVVATTPAQFRNREFAAGGPFEQGKREVVLNPLAARLFEDGVTVGDRVSIRTASGETVSARVVGVLDGSGGTGRFDDGALPRAYVPTRPFYDSTVESPTQGTEQRVYPLLTVVAESHGEVPETKEKVRSYLRSDSDAARLAPDDYGVHVRTDRDLVRRVEELLTTLTTFVTSIAVVSLVVAALGIANVMLVSVTERTREIGIMKAVGAQKRDVLQLFLTQAILLGVIGSVFGVAVGAVGGYLATDYVGLPLVFAAEVVPVAIAVGLVVGMVTGLYPAWSAARVDPIDALRYE
ncbi:ABC transporter permease [Haladaptatus salinisoli]|uniref:ABC transporter permease n=1 Tax=Haladaptatus salinisoli TaxID=2884876 RepID=UPI001D0A9BAE|nr:ABC transporter permease [Haladaptatus salinisoli]